MFFSNSSQQISDNYFDNIFILYLILLPNINGQDKFALAGIFNLLLKKSYLQAINLLKLYLSPFFYQYCFAMLLPPKRLSSF